MADSSGASMSTSAHLSFPTQLAVGVQDQIVSTHRDAQRILAEDFKPIRQSVPILYQHHWEHQLEELQTHYKLLYGSLQQFYGHTINFDQSLSLDSLIFLNLHITFFLIL